MTTFKPLLAETAEDLSALRFPLLASPKLDGIRCVKLDGKALSRKLKPIPNDFVRNWVEANLPDGIDGELLLRDRRAPFNEVSSAIMSKDGEPDFVFAAFDFLSPKGGEALKYRTETPFELRLNTLMGSLNLWQADVRETRLLIVPHYLVENVQALEHQVQINLDLGYEGTMVRDPQGRYKFGRSTLKEGILLKIKPFVDEEATVVGVVEQMHNTNEATVDNLGHTKRSSAKAGKVGKHMLGALQCVTEDGAEFEIGTGFTEEQRVNYWLADHIRTIIGKQVKFKHQPPPGGRPAGVAPRFPVFLGWRQD